MKNILFCGLWANFVYLTLFVGVSTNYFLKVVGQA